MQAEAAVCICPLIKTKYSCENDKDQAPLIATKKVPFTATELAKLKREFSRHPCKTETEYVWVVSLSGKKQILLSEKEAEGYWGLGVFLTTGDCRAPRSLTQRAAYRAGGLNPLERGDPLTIEETTHQLLENVHEAACLQVMCNCKLVPFQEFPMMLTADAQRMTPLICGLPDSLKPSQYSIARKDIGSSLLRKGCCFIGRYHLLPCRGCPNLGRQGVDLAGRLPGIN